MFRRFVFSIATVLISMVFDGPIVAQEHRVTLTELEQRLSELVKLNERLADTLEQREKEVAARVESLERSRRERATAAPFNEALIDRDRETLKVAHSAVQNPRSRVEGLERQLNQLQSQRDAEQVFEDAEANRSGLERIPSSHAYPNLYEYRGPRYVSYRGRVYADFAAFKRSPDYLLYQEENRQAAERFNDYLRDKERREDAALDVLRHRRQHMLNKIAYKER